VTDGQAILVDDLSGDGARREHLQLQVPDGLAGRDCEGQATLVDIMLSVLCGIKVAADTYGRESVLTFLQPGVLEFAVRARLGVLDFRSDLRRRIRATQLRWITPEENRCKEFGRTRIQRRVGGAFDSGELEIGVRYRFVGADFYNDAFNGSRRGDLGRGGLRMHQSPQRQKDEDF